ncbi:MAG: HipA family kinase [Silvibacterium sp.]
MKQSLRSVYGPIPSNVSASGFLYKLCGSSQPSIIVGSDGACYVVKCNGFPGHLSLVNEAVGTGLIRNMGLPAPDWVPIKISSDFIDKNPGLWFHKEGEVVIKPAPGLHFGSRLIEAPDEQRTYQMIPHSWIDRIENRSDFLGMLILDLWANNCDRRQAVFLCDAQNRLHANFIDNDFMFGGKFGFEITCPRRAMVYDLGVYRGLWKSESVERWLSIIDAVDENALRKILAGVPDEWAPRGVRLNILDQLMTRRAILSALLSDAENVLSTGYSIQYHRTRNATEPGQFRNAPTIPLLH